MPPDPSAGDNLSGPTERIKRARRRGAGLGSLRNQRETNRAPLCPSPPCLSPTWRAFAFLKASAPAVPHFPGQSSFGLRPDHLGVEALGGPGGCVERAGSAKFVHHSPMIRRPHKPAEVVLATPDRDRDLPPTATEPGEPEPQGSRRLGPAGAKAHALQSDAGNVPPAVDPVVVHADVDGSLSRLLGAGAPEAPEPVSDPVGRRGGPLALPRSRDLASCRSPHCDG